MLNGSALRDDRICRALKLAAMLSTVISTTTIPIAARAQTPSPLAEWQYSVGLPLEKLYNAPIPEWQARLGVGVTVRPRYDGAANYHALVGPMIDVRYRDLFFLSTGEGVGVNLVRTTHWCAGLAITYDLGRRAEDNSGHLDGMGNINPAPEAKLFAEYAVSKEFPLVIRADVRRNLGGSDGWTVSLGGALGPPLKFSPLLFVLVPGPHSWLRRFMVLKRSVRRMWKRPSERSSAPVVWMAAKVLGSRLRSVSEPLKRRQPATTELPKSFSSVIA